MSAPDPALNRLRWRCRRGMLELDLTLSRFLETRYARLAQEERAAFARLLTAQDDDLMDWIMGNRAPEDNMLNRIVMMMRQQYD